MNECDFCSLSGAFAWYQSATAALSATNVAAGTVATAATATVDDIAIDLVFTLTMSTAVNPTLETDGKIYVIQNGVVTVAHNQDNRFASGGTMVFTKAVYSSDHTTSVTPEDARGLNAQKYAVYLKSDGDWGHVRIAASTTAAEEGKLERVVNDASSNGSKGILLGYVTFTADGSSAPTVAYTNHEDTGTALRTFYYAYNPVSHAAAGSSQAPDSYEANVDVAGITITLTLQGS